MAMLPMLQEYVKELQITALLNPSVLFLVFFSLLLVVKKSKARKYNLPPSPPKLPIIGNLHQLGSLPHRTFCTLSGKYGPLLLLHMGSARMLVVSSPEITEEIVKTHDTVFANRHKPMVGDVLFYGGNEIGFSPCDEFWREMKKLCVSELLSQSKVQSFHSVREKEVANMITKLQKSCPEKAPVDLREMFITISNNIICTSVLGRNYGGEKPGTRYGDVSQKIVELLTAFSFRDYFPYIHWMDKFTGLVGRLIETFKELDTFLDQVIKEHESLKSENEHSEKDFVDILLEMRKDGKAGFNLTQEQLKGILVDMLTGGNDTISALMEWVMTELVRHPSIIKKTQEEIRGVVGKKSKIDMDDISQMEYLRCVIKESLRLHPPGPFLIPRQTSTWVKLKGYDIPPRTILFINIWAIQMDPKIWDMPKEFRPERFHDNPVDFKGQYFQFLPFGSGRRGCPGMPFSIAVVEYVIANLLYTFDWDLANEEDMDISEVYGVVVRKKTPLQLVPTSHSL